MAVAAAMLTKTILGTTCPVKSESSRLEAIALRLEAIAVRLEGELTLSHRSKKEKANSERALAIQALVLLQHSPSRLSSSPQESPLWKQLTNTKSFK